MTLRRDFEEAPPLQLGTIVKPYGKIEMVGVTGGERYYWLIDKNRVISMFPADVIEPLARKEHSS